MRLLLLAAVLVWTGLTTVAGAQQRPVLRSEVSTLSDIVTVGDFYSDAGAVADEPLFRAPDLGTSGSVPAETVAIRARAAGLAEAGTDGLSAVVVRRVADSFDPERLQRLTQEILADRDASINPEDLDISFYSEPRTFHADPRSDTPVRTERVLWSRTDGRFQIFLTVRGQAGNEELVLTGQAREMVEVVALVQPLSRGEILKASDLSTVRLARAQVPARALYSAEEMIGMAARTSLRPNKPLSSQDFEQPVLIARGEKITLTYYLPGMKLTTRGQAMTDGAKGDTIDVMNLESRRIVPGFVVSRGQVQVSPSAPLVASLNQRIN